MSASTVSITANPAASRRRPVLVGEKKSKGIELLPVEAQVNGGGDGGGNNNDVMGNDIAGYRKDLSHHSIRGDAVLRRTSKDLAQVKKSAAGNSTVSPRRTRKVVTKPEKPRWLTVVSVFTKNFVLLLVLIGLVQLVRKFASKSGDYSTAGAQMGLSEMEGRIAEVQSFLKTTTKMIQAQVDIVDKKFEHQAWALKEELNKKIDDFGVISLNELSNLVGRTAALEKSVEDLKAVAWLTKEEFERFYEELKKAKGGVLGETDMSLDLIRAFAKEIVEKEIEKHAADGLGRVDYALASGGGEVVKHSEPFMATKGSNWFLKGDPLGVHHDASKMLKPSFGEPGQCFALKGSTGFVQIRLRTAIIPEAITLEHIAESVAFDRSSAPKDCRVSGWLQGDPIDSLVDINTEKMLLLTEFTYDLKKSNAQTFDISESVATGMIDTVRLDFKSNHGSTSHTCIYRLRVHGYEPNAVMATES